MLGISAFEGQREGLLTSLIERRKLSHIYKTLAGYLLGLSDASSELNFD